MKLLNLYYKKSYYRNLVNMISAFIRFANPHTIVELFSKYTGKKTSSDLQLLNCWVNLMDIKWKFVWDDNN